MTPRITGLILAGGQGSRLDGRDKGLVMLGRRSLAERVIRRFAPQVDQLLVNANRHDSAYGALGHPVIGDLRSDYPGPLAGIEAGLARIPHGLLAVVPCDSPFLPDALVARLLAALLAGDAEIAVARSGGELQPAFALIRAELHAPLGEFMASGDRRLAAWYRQQRHVVVDFDDARAFSNLNTAGDFIAAETFIEGERHARVLGIAGYSGSGKTTLLKRLLPALGQAGVKVAVLKHAHHQFDIDYPGKDSYELRHAGATCVLVASSQRWACITERGVDAGDPPLDLLLEQLEGAGADLILVEGFRHERFPKLEVHRPSLGRALLCGEDESVIALASDEPLVLPRPLPRFALDDTPALTEYILQRLAAARALEHPP